MVTNEEFESIMQRYDTIQNDLLNVEVKKTNPFLEEHRKFPLGTREPLSDYDNIDDIHEEDIVWKTITEANFDPTLIIGMSGYGKTKITKREVYYRYKAGNKIAIFDLKNIDWLKAKYTPTSTYGLLKDELPDRLPIKLMIPSYIEKEVSELIKTYFKNVVTAPPLHKWTKEDFYKMGYSPTGVETLFSSFFAKNIIDPLKIQKKLPALRGAGMAGVKSALIRRIVNLIDSNFIDLTKPVPNIEKIWNEGKIPAIHFFSQSTNAMSFYVSLAIQSMWKYAQRYAKPTTIVIPDMPLVAGKDEKGKPMPAVDQILKVLTQWRDLKMNLIGETQAPDLIDDKIVGNCKHYIIGKSANLQSLDKAGFSSEVIRAANNLIYEDKYPWTAQALLVKENRMEYEKFFVLNSPIGHFIRLKGLAI